MSLHVVGIAGSLRAGSFNRALLAAAVELAPAGMTIEVADLRPIPLYDGDVEAAGVPAAVAELKSRVRGAGALLIATPEYNYSVPGVLKNALDWASRPFGDSAWPGKPLALMSASTGMLGGSRAQYHLRQTLLFLDVVVVSKPEVFVTFAGQKFDETGRLTDEATRGVVAALLKALVNLTRKQ